MDLLTFAEAPNGGLIVSNGLALTETVAEALEALKCTPVQGSQIGAYLVGPDVAKKPMIKAQIRTAAVLALRQAADRKKAEFKYKHTKKVLDIMKAIKHKTASRIKVVTIGDKKYIGGDTYEYRDFIKDHKQMALKGSFIQGSRVLLSQENTASRIATKNISVSLFDKGFENRKNAFRFPLLSRFLALKSRSLAGIRSCNMSFFRNDCIRVNGFNEDFIGWGREDSEFAVRLVNSGILRRNVRFSALAGHLGHRENPRQSLADNDRILEQAIAGKLTTCPNGIDKYLVNKKL